MKMMTIPLAAIHYAKTRKHLWAKYLVAVLFSGLCFFVMYKINLKDGVDIAEVFKDFINVQINVVAILISFSIAIITILVSADNPNIQRLKSTDSKNCKPLAGGPLSLFQVLLSNVTYNVLIEVVYLAFLIICVFLQLFVDVSIYKILMAVCVFFIFHILHILLESVSQMYLTFWK